MIYSQWMKVFVLLFRWWWIIPYETHQPPHADPSWREWFCVSPQEFQYPGCKSICLWHFFIDLQRWRLQCQKSVFSCVHKILNFCITIYIFLCPVLMYQHRLQQQMLIFPNKWLKYLLSTGVNEKFWYVSSSGLVCSDGEKPEDFFLEFLEHGRIAIKGSNGKYLRGDQGGTLMGDGPTVDASSLWEYWSFSISVIKEGTRRQGAGPASISSYEVDWH